MKQKWIALCLVAAMLVGVLSGCSVDMEATINADGSGSITETMLVEQEYLNNGAQLSEDSGFVWEDVTENGTAYKKGTKTITFQAFSDLKTESGFEDAVFTFNKKKFVVKQKGAATASTSDSSSELTEALKEKLQISYTFTFPYDVLKTNGTVQSDGKTVVWDNDKSYSEGMFWAVFSEDLLDSSIKAATLSGVKNNACYNKKVTVKAAADTVIASLKVNGKDVGSDTCTISKEGKNTVICKTANGKTTKVSFVIDTTKPKVSGVASGKTYKSARTIKFSDKYGVKSATLNGKKISTGKKVSKKGSYKLVVTDKAGNKNIVKFKIK
jgi:hypothetical protein